MNDMIVFWIDAGKLPVLQQDTALNTIVAKAPADCINSLFQLFMDNWVAVEQA